MNGTNEQMQPTAQWMPCIGEAGLVLFGATADQRATLGEEVFMTTHTSIEMRTQSAGRLLGRMTEQDLLAQLTTTQSLRPGNRVFVLYGAAGAGKSELLRWLAMKLAQHEPRRAEVLVRVSRTELDVVRIVERLQSRLSGRFFSAQTHARWSDLRTKPLTLAKLLVLSALERMLTRDEEINALFYWLTAPVQRNLERGLEALADNHEDAGILELFSEEDWVDLSRSTELSQLLEPEVLRAELVAAFRTLLLENIQLPQTLQHLSDEVTQQHNVRPILLIDDLVRSLNLFAGDLMDYFITLEAGSWDVVVGVTPASLQTHARGRQLLERIAYLDTIDDRVQKLWISDDYGNESYFLDESNCADFAARYLDEYRRLNGIVCSHCVQRPRCEELGHSVEGRLTAPFSRIALERVLRAMPPGKGKVRHFLRALGEMLQRLAKNEGILDVVSSYARRDFMARAKVRSEATVVELYAELNEGTLTAEVDMGLARFFGTTLAESYSVEPLMAKSGQSASARLPHTVVSTEDPERDAIRRWLEGEATNRQLLRPLRQGVARWLRLFGTPHILTSRGVARPSGVLRWAKRYLDVTPPVILEDVDEVQEGITVGRSVGMLAFCLAQLARAKGEETHRLTIRISEDEFSAELLYAAHRLQNHLHAQLEDQLGMSPSRAALHLYFFTLSLTEEDISVPGVPLHFYQWLLQERARRGAWKAEVPEETFRMLSRLFTDFFQLRENVVDGPAIETLCQSVQDDTWLMPLLGPKPEKLSPDFMLGDRPFFCVIEEVQAMIVRWSHVKSMDGLSPSTHAVLNALTASGQRGVSLSHISPSVWTELAALRPDLYETLRVRWDQRD